MPPAGLCARTYHVLADGLNKDGDVQLVGQAQQGSQVLAQLSDAGRRDELGVVDEAQQARHLVGREAVEGRLQHDGALLHGKHGRCLVS